MREEALQSSIVITIGPMSHADSGANLWQHVGCLLESLIAMNDRSRHVFFFAKVSSVGISQSMYSQPRFWAH